MRSDHSTTRLPRLVGAARWLVSALLAALLLVPIGPHAATAAERPKTPILIGVEGGATTYGDEIRGSLLVRWELETVEPPVWSLLINVYDESGALIVTSTQEGSPLSVPLDSSGIHEAKGVSVLKPGMTYCVGIQARGARDSQDRSTISDESERQCVTIPGRQDLVISEIRGKEDIEWAATNQRNPVYIFMLRNDGGDATDREVEEIKTSGVVRIADEQLPILIEGWEDNGFTCERIGVSGGANAGLLCSGGTLKAGQQINPAILTRVTGRGFGAVHAVINVNRGRGDADPGDNRLTLNVQVS
jgi:hypothetical protein